MTANQLRYQELQELKRSNQEKERETNRSNLAREFETRRSNSMNEVLKERQQDLDANEIFASYGYLTPARDWIEAKKVGSEKVGETLKQSVKSIGDKIENAGTILKDLITGAPDTSYTGGGGGMRAR